MESGEAALNELRGGEYALVITDRNTPGMDGYLTKPIRPKKLEALLEKCVSQRGVGSDVAANMETQ